MTFIVLCEQDSNLPVDSDTSKTIFFLIGFAESWGKQSKNDIPISEMNEHKQKKRFMFGNYVCMEFQNVCVSSIFLLKYYLHYYNLYLVFVAH